jgi:exodeoxyribonuclease V alpha subunit
VDEASMVDLHLMWRLLRGISPSCRVVLVGDTAQLPPVGAGFVLKEIIESDLIPRVHLEDIFRQGEGSGVVRSAHDIYRGVVPTGCSDYNFKELRNNDYVLEEIIKVCKELKLDGVDFHVMSPTHHGVLGVTRLNKELRSVLNPRNINKNTLKVGKDEIREGDRVMVTKNDYNLDVFNGDIGVVHLISKSGVEVVLKGTKKEILVEIPRNRVGSLLRLAYCTTVHKAQGQEYHTIVMPMVIEHGRTLLKRSLYYTAITRATDKVFVFGDLDSIEVSVSNDTTNNNLCGLKNRLKYDI